MYSIQIDVTALAAIWVGGALLMLLLLSLSARFCLGPFVDALCRFRTAAAADRSAAALDRRLSRLEARMADEKPSSGS